MRSTLAFVLAAALAAAGTPAAAAAAPRQGTGQISGTAQSQSGQPLANTTVRIRDLSTGQIVGTTTTDASGAFDFTGLEAGQYAIEVVDVAGNVVGTSGTLTLAPGAMTITGLDVGTTPLIGNGSFFGSALGVSTLVAAGGTVVAVIATQKTASPSR